MTGLLTQHEIDQYQDDGYLFPKRAFSPDEAAQLRSRVEALEAKYKDQKLAGRTLAQYFRVNAHHLLPLAAEIASNKVILDHVESILGSNILVWSCEFFIKEADTQKIVSWHQDMTYWGLGEKEDADTDNLVSAWVALSPATKASGCMQFVAGSHKKTIQPHNDTFGEDNLLSRGQEIAVDVSDDEATDIVLQPGEFSLHHGRTFHGSGPNVSDDRRIGIVMRYVTPKVKQIAGAKDYAMLVRGFDADQNWTHIARPDKEFSEHGLALYDQVLKDQAKVLAKGAEKAVKMYG